MGLSWPTLHDGHSVFFCFFLLGLELLERGYIRANEEGGKGGEK